MKKSVILIALSFVFVSFLNAQNRQSETTKINNVEKVYLEDGFYKLLGDNSETPSLHSDYYELIDRHKINQDPFSGIDLNSKSAREIRMCCITPILIIAEYDIIRED